jgi:phytoene dehydrogenase-like protein
MVNATHNNGQDWDVMKSRIRKAIIEKLSRMLGEDIEPLIETEETLDPVLIEARTSSYKGSLYGASSNNWLSAFLRHPNSSLRMRGLYFAGGSVHPGGGIPLCLMSSKIVTDQIPDLS